MTSPGGGAPRWVQQPGEALTALLLRSSRHLAVVGCSADPDKPSGGVPLQLARHGWEITAVNPRLRSWHGRPAVPTLADVPEPIDLVVVFRPSAEAAGVADAAVAAGTRALWLQQGIVSAAARAAAQAAGVLYVEDRCTAVERAVHRVTPPAG